jgi:hypothetical protein
MEVENQIIRSIFDGGDFLQNNSALQFEIRVQKERVLHQIGENLKGKGEVFIQNPGLEAGVLAGCVGIQRPAEALQGKSDFFGGAPLRPLEDQVLQEVTCTHEALRLVG